MVPRGTAQTDIAARLFSNFRELAGILHRYKEQNLAKSVEQVNQTRHLRQLIPGEIVFRKMPPKARPPKHLLGEPSMGPYVVVSQSTFNSARLKDPATGKFVEGGEDIPLEQILAGPRRGLLKFESSPEEGRSVGQMIDGSGLENLPAGVKATGWKPSKTKGWRGLRRGQFIAYRSDNSRELSVAMVLYNDKDSQSVNAHSCRSLWSGMAVQHRKEYRLTNAEGAETVLEPTEDPVQCVVFYRAIVKVVELYVDGRMMQGHASTLSKGGWSFKVYEGESIRAIASALIADAQLSREADSLSTLEELGLGLRANIVKQRMLRDEAVYSIAEPQELMKAPWKSSEPAASCSASRCPSGAKATKKKSAGEEHRDSSTLLAAQRKKMSATVKPEEGPTQYGSSLEPDVLDPDYASGLKSKSRKDVAQYVAKSDAEVAHRGWMEKLRRQDYSGPTLDRSRYLALRHNAVEGNPRQTDEYRKMCCDAVGVGAKPDKERYAHLQEADFDPIRWVVSRGSGCMWLPDTPRTTVKGFRHRLITRGPPIRGRLFRLNRADTEWIEKAIQEDVNRGQLEKGSSEWGFPAFPTKENAAYKAIKRARRMVVDYRELNKVTVRKFFLIPNSDYIKSTVAGNELISVGDLKEGFNQVDNEEDTKKKMAVLSAGGCWLPRGLTFGPTNGPEDFQELVFTVFQRRLYKDWFLFVDDLSVATGRRKCHGEGPSGAHDVSCPIREMTTGEKGEVGLNVRAGSSFPSPFAHELQLREVWLRISLILALLYCVVLMKKLYIYVIGGSVQDRKLKHMSKSSSRRKSVLRKMFPSRSCYLFVSVAQVLLLSRLFPARLAAGLVPSLEPSVIAMPYWTIHEDPDWHRQLEEEYYDNEKLYKVPSAPWWHGDDPKPCHTHVDIYVSGWMYGGSESGGLVAAILMTHFLILTR